MSTVDLHKESATYYGNMVMKSNINTKEIYDFVPVGEDDTIYSFLLFTKLSDKSDTPLFPLGRFTWIKDITDNVFSITNNSKKRVDLGIQFANYIIKYPTSKRAKGFNNSIGNKGVGRVRRVNCFFKNDDDYSDLDFVTYMLSITYLAKFNAYRLATLSKETYKSNSYVLSDIVRSFGAVWPNYLPDIIIYSPNIIEKKSKLSIDFKLELGSLIFEGRKGILIFLQKLIPNRTIFLVELILHKGIDLSYGSVSLVLTETFNFFFAKNLLAKDIESKIILSFDPKFKFIQVQLKTVLCFLISGKQIKVSAIGSVNNIELFLSLDVKEKQGLFQLPDYFQHFTLIEIGGGIGVELEDSMPIIGLEAEYMISDDVQVNDRKIALIFGVEEGFPVPLFLSFYATKLKASELSFIFKGLSLIGVKYDLEFNDLSFWWNANPLAPLLLPDGTTAHSGYGFSCWTALFGINIYVDFKVGYNGLTADCDLSPINIGSVFSLTGNGKGLIRNVDKDGNLLKNNRVPTKLGDTSKSRHQKHSFKTLVPAGGASCNVNLNLDNPNIIISGKMTFLNLFSQEVDYHNGKLKISENGICYEIDFGKVTRIKYSNHYSFSVGLPQINGIDLGKINISGQFQLDFEVSDIGCFAVHICVKEISADIPCKDFYVELNIDISKEEEFIEYFIKHLEANGYKLFKSILHNVDNLLNSINQGAIEIIGDVSKILSIGYKVSKVKFAQCLRELNYDSSHVAKELNTIYNVTASSAKQLLDAAGFSENEIENSLKEIFDYTIPIPDPTNIPSDISHEVKHWIDNI